MEKKQAQEYIEEVLNSKFDQEKYELFIRNLLNDFEPRDNSYSGNLIPEAFRDHISYYKRIGKYTDPEGEQLDILIVQTRSVNKLERARTALRNFVVRHLKNFDKQFALVAFYSKEDEGADWRLSLVKIEYESQRDEKGKIKIKEELVPAKRFSFLVGEYEDSYTAQKQLFPLLANTYSDPLIVMEEDGDGSIEGAFGIEKVTDEFFEQYKNLFQSLINNEGFKSSIQEVGLEPNRFVKKLLGQIVFLYFLQKKGWLGVPKDQKMGEGSKRFLQDRYAEVIANGKDYFTDFLRYLFYAALAREHHDKGIKYYFEQLECKVPFLNGGLFEAEYDWENTNINIPNNLFRNDERNKSGDKGTGILDVFDRYNFTIKEDEPLEKEVAVDPEMLGKVFENMLEITERRSKGAFYTPREIVHYMCQESLIHFLDNAINDYTASYQALDTSQPTLFGGSADKKGNLKLEIEYKDGERIPKEDLEQFIRKGHLALENDEAARAAMQRIEQGEIKSTKQKLFLPGTIAQYAKELDEALANIKICDPAIGSGAFPVGLLHEIVTARKVLVPYLSKDYIRSLQVKSGIDDADTMPSEYYFKRHAIQESIYGVDIDASAIDIARLRLWLSMIVEEEDYDTIEALPNLDYKIVCGNSLIGFPHNWQSPSFDLIENLKVEFFNETDIEKKETLKAQINAEINARMASSERVFGYKVDFDFKLFFSEVWHKKGGFDVVIGNPPYVQIQKFRDSKFQKQLQKQDFLSFSNRGDLYCLFYEKGYRLLREKGLLSFITSNKWMRAGYGKKLRWFFQNRTRINQLIDFGDSPIFSEATTYTNILLFESAKEGSVSKVWDLSSAYKKATSLNRMLEEKVMGAPIFSDESFVITTPELAKIKKRIEKVGTRLGDWNISINYGVKTGLNKAFIIDKKKREELLTTDPNSAELIKPILRGRDIKRYHTEFQDLWLIVSMFGSYKTLPKNYPAIFQHLKGFENELKARGQCRYTSSGKKKPGDYPGQHHWLELDNNPKEEYFEELEKEKILFAEIVFDSAFYYDISGIYPEATAFVIIGEGTKYLTALLNSQLLTFIFRAFYAGGDLRGNTFRYKKAFLQNLPVVKPQDSVASLLGMLVTYVQTAKTLKQDLYASYFEVLIDGLVYELYFHTEITKANKSIQSNLTDLRPIPSQISKEEQFAIIKSEFDRLYDPNHPVRNNLETLSSIEEVKVIRDALN